MVNDSLNPETGKFAKKYTDDDFLSRLSTGMLKTTPYLARQVGCSIPTALRYLVRLQEKDKVAGVPINDGTTQCWLLCGAEEYIYPEGEEGEAKKAEHEEKRRKKNG